MPIRSLTSTASTALHGLGVASRQVEDVAAALSHGTTDAPDGSSFAVQYKQIAHLMELRQQTQATLKVFSTAEQLLSEFLWLPRR